MGGEMDINEALKLAVTLHNDGQVEEADSSLHSYSESAAQAP